MEETIVWEAPASCPGAAVVRAQVARLLARSEGHARFQARAMVKQGDEGFALRLSVTVGDAVGERELTERSCDALADVTATIVALAVDPAAALAGPQTRAPDVAPLVLVLSPRPSPDPVPAPTEPPPAPPPRTAESAPTRATAGPFVSAEVGFFPTAEPLVGLAGSVRRGPNAFLLAGAISQTRRYVNGADGAEIASTVLAATACRHVFGLPVGPCAGVSVVRVTGHGLDAGQGLAPVANARTVGRGELGGEAAWEAGIWGLRVAATATIPLARPSFVVADGERPLFRPSAVGGRGEVGIFARF